MKLIFDEWESNKKTGHVKIDVLNNKPVRDLLGTIEWEPRWKCYVWLQNNMIQMSADCLMQVVSKMDSLEGTKRLIT